MVMSVKAGAVMPAIPCQSASMTNALSMAHRLTAGWDGGFREYGFAWKRKFVSCLFKFTHNLSVDALPP